MVAVVVFEFSVMRCQPLRRALGIKFISNCLIFSILPIFKLWSLNKRSRPYARFNESSLSVSWMQ
ncbi:hypothetical protein DK128_18425 [Vibrio cholerae O1 biovar El Tor]|nr:hypothetical protein [Vibrio cholerae]MCO4752721.1 hypothetical protein [Vibrio cholerae O1 biovar El Tor]